MNILNPTITIINIRIEFVNSLYAYSSKLFERISNPSDPGRFGGESYGKGEHPLDRCRIAPAFWGEAGTAHPAQTKGGSR
jgi:hypothetical protein